MHARGRRRRRAPRDAPGVIDIAHGPDGGWVALVGAAHSDAFLAAALSAGASVREVGPA